MSASGRFAEVSGAGIANGFDSGVGTQGQRMEGGGRGDPGVNGGDRLMP